MSFAPIPPGPLKVGDLVKSKYAAMKIEGGVARVAEVIGNVVRLSDSDRLWSPFHLELVSTKGEGEEADQRLKEIGARVEPEALKEIARQRPFIVGDVVCSCNRDIKLGPDNLGTITAFGGPGDRELFAVEPSSGKASKFWHKDNLELVDTRCIARSGFTVGQLVRRKLRGSLDFNQAKIWFFDATRPNHVYLREFAGGIDHAAGPWTLSDLELVPAIEHEKVDPSIDRAIRARDGAEFRIDDMVTCTPLTSATALHGAIGGFRRSDGYACFKGYEYNFYSLDLFEKDAVAPPPVVSKTEVEITKKSPRGNTYKLTFKVGDKVRNSLRPQQGIGEITRILTHTTPYQVEVLVRRPVLESQRWNLEHLSHVVEATSPAIAETPREAEERILEKNIDKPINIVRYDSKGARVPDWAINIFDKLMAAEPDSFLYVESFPTSPPPVGGIVIEPAIPERLRLHTGPLENITLHRNFGEDYDTFTTRVLKERAKVLEQAHIDESSIARAVAMVDFKIGDYVQIHPVHLQEARECGFAGPPQGKIIRMLNDRALLDDEGPRWARLSHLNRMGKILDYEGVEVPPAMIDAYLAANETGALVGIHKYPPNQAKGDIGIFSASIGVIEQQTQNAHVIPYGIMRSLEDAMKQALKERARIMKEPITHLKKGETKIPKWAKPVYELLAASPLVKVIHIDGWAYPEVARGELLIHSMMGKQLSGVYISTGNAKHLPPTRKIELAAGERLETFAARVLVCLEAMQVPENPKVKELLTELQRAVPIEGQTFLYRDNCELDAQLRNDTVASSLDSSEIDGLRAGLEEVREQLAEIKLLRAKEDIVTYSEKNIGFARYYVESSKHVTVLYERAERAPVQGTTQRAVIRKENEWFFAGTDGVAIPVDLDKLSSLELGISGVRRDGMSEYLRAILMRPEIEFAEVRKRIFAVFEQQATGHATAIETLTDRHGVSVPMHVEELFAALLHVGVSRLNIRTTDIGASSPTHFILHIHNDRAVTMRNARDQDVSYGRTMWSVMEFAQYLHGELVKHGLDPSVSFVSQSPKEPSMSNMPPIPPPTPTVPNFSDVGKVLGNAAANGLARSTVEEIGDRTIEFVRDACDHHPFIEMVCSTETGRELVKGGVAIGIVVLPVFFPQVVKHIPKPALIQRIAAIQFDSSVGRVGKPFIKKGMNFLEALVKIGEKLPELEQSVPHVVETETAALTNGSEKPVLDFGKVQNGVATPASR